MTSLPSEAEIGIVGAGLAGLDMHVRRQLERCFGADGDTPRAVHIEDWANDKLVATHLDVAVPTDHPRVGPAILREAHAGGRLWFAASETAARSPGLIGSPGLIEGAFVAAEHAVAGIIT